MPIRLRNGVWQIDIRTPSGKRVRQSAGTADKQAAQELHDKIKSDLWRQEKIGEKPAYSWDQACVRWLTEMSHKATIADDASKIKTMVRLRGLMLADITRDTVAGVIAGLTCSDSTKNRYLNLIRAILRKAEREWEWLDRAPSFRRYVEPRRRIRWLTREEARRLLDELPQHMADMAVFSLSTGLRKQNVLDLEWSQIDMQRRVAWIHPDQAKARRAIGVPLNADAIDTLKRCLGRNAVHVFTYQGMRISDIGWDTWKSALHRAGIDDFRWHDLRHTWASWLVQAGTPLAALQAMGGWETPQMVQRYAHLAPEHLHQHSDVLSGLDKNWSHGEESRPLLEVVKSA